MPVMIWCVGECIIMCVKVNECDGDIVTRGEAVCASASHSATAIVCGKVNECDGECVRW